MGLMQKRKSLARAKRRALIESKMPIRKTFTISCNLDMNKPLKEFHYFRKVSYFKGKRYVYFWRKRNVEYDLVQSLSRQILKDIDAQIMKDLMNELPANNSKTSQKKIDNMARKEVCISSSSAIVPDPVGT
jgi:hypothetical protein